MKIKTITLIAIIAMLAACGRDSGDGGQDAPSPDAQTGVTGPGNGVIVGDDIPIETFLIEGKVPERLKAKSITVHFRSNISDAAFECRREPSSNYTPCDGDSYTFTDLVHGRSYQLDARAKTSSGRLDLTPVEISFHIDNIQGETFSSNAGGQVEQIDARDLPQIIGTTDDGGAVVVEPEDRSLQVGSFYAIAVPYNMMVTTYSTSKTYNNSLQVLRLIDDGTLSHYTSTACDREWERQVDGPAGLSYCQGTPNRSQHSSAYGNSLPYNHIEIVNEVRPVPDEKIMMATFDADHDPLEYRMGISSICSSALQSGSSPVPLLNKFFGVKPETKIFHWCLTAANNGDWWWVGTFGTRMEARPDSPRVRVIYTLKSTRGITSGTAFAARAGRILPSIIVPLQPVTE